MILGLGMDGKGYVIEDLSGKHGPRGWAKIVQDAFHNHGADQIIAEANYGGAMVEEVIQTHDRSLPVKLVNASRGKHVRAEPIASLYDNGKVKHLGYFPELEEQMQLMTGSGYSGLYSPDRLDAMVWGFHGIFPGLTRKEGGEFLRTGQRTQVNHQERNMAKLMGGNSQRRSPQTKSNY